VKGWSESHERSAMSSTVGVDEDGSPGSSAHLRTGSRHAPLRMKSWLEGFARRLWRDEAGVAGRVVRLLLIPLEKTWWLAVALRNRRFDDRGGMVVEGLRVISVGNLAVGGTGKTPIASWVTRMLIDTGVHPAVLHGGYAMDEPALHRRWTPDAPVIVKRDRVAGAREALELGAGAVVLDDGFQHRRLSRDVDLVMLAVEDAFPGPLLPRGPYREPPEALERASAIVLSRRTASELDARGLAEVVRIRVPEVPVIACAHLHPSNCRPLVGSSSGSVDLRSLGSVLVLTAVGRPDSVRRSVGDMVGAEVVLVAHADHHEFSELDARSARRRAGSRPIVVTEKDAVKLERFAEALGDCLVIEDSLRWDWGEAALRALIDRGGRGA